MMQDFLVFNLTASLGAMGELAGHERRGGLIWPARSAIIGLMGAALGIDRAGDFSALDALNITVAIFDAGAPLRDFHTVQTVPTAAIKSPNSRPEALRALRAEDNAVITQRDYRAGILYGVAVAGHGLQPIADALAQPHFTLYLGRKSCPLAAPTGAKVVQAQTVDAALSQITLPPWRSKSFAHTILETDPSGEVVMDMPRDRALWHFDARRVGTRAVVITAGANENVS